MAMRRRPDVTWDIVGGATSTGKVEFEALIDGPPGAGLPRLVAGRQLEGDDEVVRGLFGTVNRYEPGVSLACIERELRHLEIG